MAIKKVPFSKISIKMEVPTTEITIQDTKILVCQRLPMEDKMSLVDITLQQATVNGIIHPLLIDVQFILNIIFKYTNLTFTDKQREDPFKLFDQLQYSGIVSEVLLAIPVNEYSELQNYLKETRIALERKSTSIAAKITDYLEDLPQKMAEAAEIAKTFDIQQFKEIINMANALRTDNFDAIARASVDETT